MAYNVTIIGDGAMATACSLLLTETGHNVTLFSAFPDYLDQLRRTRDNVRFLPGVAIPDSVELTAEPQEAFAKPDLVISAVPCQFLRDLWQRLAPHADISVPICSVTKGIENDTLLRPSQIIQQLLGPVPVAVLSGPSIATELAKRLPATVVVAGDHPQLARTIQKTFSTEWFRVYTNPDLLGVELAAATKNVIALAAGIIDGLGAGDNAKAALLTRGLVEITRLGLALGAKGETFAGLAGLGDLVTTCISPFGRNRSAGQLIGQGKSVDQVRASTHSVIEGIATTRSVAALARKHHVEMPITFAVHAVLFENCPPRQAITNLMTRRLKPELSAQ
jgi:glycerol-3-phosphate dehydrogenase (NAD(P)+)